MPTKKHEDTELLYLPPPTKVETHDSDVAKPSSNDEESFFLPPPKIEGFKPLSQSRQESLSDKIKRKSGENPFVPAGALLTAGWSQCS